MLKVTYIFDQNVYVTKNRSFSVTLLFLMFVSYTLQKRYWCPGSFSSMEE